MALEQYEFDFDVVYPKTLDAGNLRAKYDVILFPDGGIPESDRQGSGAGGFGGGARPRAGVLIHVLEIEDLKVLPRQRVLDIVEESAVATSLDPFGQSLRQVTRQRTAQGEQLALVGIENVDVLEAFVELSILRVRQPLAVLRFEEDGDE